jgi:Fe-S-cluster-containing dehydrogenase component
MDKWNLIIDVAECSNCNNCVLAAKDELVGNDFPGYSAPHPAQGPGVVRGSAPVIDAAYVPKMCNHCDDAPCVAAGGGAVTQREDGIVIIDPVRAKGRRDLADACPYGAIHWNEALQLPQNWFFDAHLLDAGVAAPRCVAACPTRAIEAVKTSDERMSYRVRAEELRTLKPEAGTRPRVYYRNLHRADGCFIGGSVTAIVAGRVECLAGACVELRGAESALATCSTDAFGDFKFDGLLPHSGNYDISVHHPEYGQVSQTVLVADRSVVLPELRLLPAQQPIPPWRQA